MLRKLFFLAGAVLLLVCGCWNLWKHRKLLRQGAKVSARIVAVGQNYSGRYYVLEFQTEGGVHRLNYRMPQKGQLAEVHGERTLYYDPLHPKNMYLEGDRAVQMGNIFYFGCAAVLMVMAYLI